MFTSRVRLVRILSLAALAAFVPFSAVAVVAQSDSQKADGLRDSLDFHATFDGTGDATVSRGDGRILTAESLQRKTLTPGIHRPHVSIAAGQGKFGDCLRFTDKAKEVLCFPGALMHYAAKNWSGSVSFWMKLTPDEDLKPGYCDPIQITQHAWNNAAFFVDFDKDLPRDFRLGAFSDLSHWNPDNIAWEKWPVEKRPMVTVRKPPFSRREWTHVAFTWSDLNATENKPSVATLYLNGKSMGSVHQPMKFTWDQDKSAIMLGIDYIGDLDDLMIFRRALTADEVMSLSGAGAALSSAGEKSVRPGINDSFRDPDPKAFTERFEIESREVFAQREKIVAAVKLRPSDIVADIGAGTGLFTRLFAKQLGSDGRVIAVDIAKKFLDYIEVTSREAGLRNVETLLCRDDSTELPENSTDVAFICDTYHHFEYPRKTMASLFRALKPGGRVVVIDFRRIEGESSEWTMNHVRAGQDVFEAEIASAGFHKTGEVNELLKENYMVVFEKPAGN